MSMRCNQARFEVGHLLGIPVLLIMSVFYGLTLETVAAERRRNRLLREDVEELKQSEQNLEERRTQLETARAGLKQGLSRANQEIRQGRLNGPGWSDSCVRRKSSRPWDVWPPGWRMSSIRC